MSATIKTRVERRRSAQFRFFDYCEVFFDTGLEVTYPLDRKSEDKHFGIMGLGPEAVVFKRKWTRVE